MKSKRDREEPCYICGHYHDFEAGEPCSTCGHVMTHQEKKQCETVLPTAILPGFLYLGSYDTASRAEMLKAMAITHILNTVPACTELYRNTFQYCTSTSSPPDFEECFQFIDSVQQTSDGKVLVYCMSGISRSPAVIIAYLMKTLGWRLLESYKWVKQKRGTIQLKAEDKKRLIDYEMQTCNSCSVPDGFEAVEVSSSGMFGASTSSAGMEGLSSSATVTAPAFAVPAGHSPWALSPGSTTDGQPVFGTSAVPVSDGGVQFIFGSAQGQGTLSSNAEMEM